MIDFLIGTGARPFVLPPATSRASRTVSSLRISAALDRPEFKLFGVRHELPPGLAVREGSLETAEGAGSAGGLANMERTNGALRSRASLVVDAK
jgi:hypothetical protein